MRRAFYQRFALFIEQTDVSGKCRTRQLLILSNNVRSSLFMMMTTVLNGRKSTSYLFDLPFLSSVDIPWEDMLRTQWKLHPFVLMGRYTGTWLLFYSDQYPLLSFPWIPNLQLSHNAEQKHPDLPDYFFKQIVITLNFFYKEDTEPFDTFLTLSGFSCQIYLHAFIYLKSWALSLLKSFVVSQLPFDGISLSGVCLTTNPSFHASKIFFWKCFSLLISDPSGNTKCSCFALLACSHSQGCVCT